MALARKPSPPVGPRSVVHAGSLVAADEAVEDRVRYLEAAVVLDQRRAGMLLLLMMMTPMVAVLLYQRLHLACAKGQAKNAESSRLDSTGIFANQLT